MVADPGEAPHLEGEAALTRLGVEGPSRGLEA
jgi:hypothetical protein